MAEKIIPPRRGEVLSDSGIGTTRFMEYLERTAAQVNENVDEIEVSLPPDTSSPGLALALKRISDLEVLLGFSSSSVLAGIPQGFTVVSTAADYTTKGKEIVVCTNTIAITITLNSVPADKEEVHIIRQNFGPVDVSGAISGDTIKTISRRYDSPHLVFTVAANEWSVI